MIKKLLCLLFMLSPSIYADELIKINQSPENKIPVTELGHYLNAGVNFSFKSVKQLPTSHGTLSIKYQQYYNQLPVYGSSLVVESTRDGTIKTVYGNFLQKTTLNIKEMNQLISQDEALDIVVKAFGISVASSQLSNNKPKKIVYINHEKKAVVAYFVDIFSSSGVRPQAIVNASNGEIIFQQNGMLHEGKSSIKREQVSTEVPTPVNTESTGYNVVAEGGIIDKENKKDDKHVYELNVSHYIKPNNWDKSERNMCFMRDPNRNIDVTKDGSGFVFICNGHKAPNTPHNSGISMINDLFHYSGKTIDMYNTYLGERPLSGVLKANAKYVYGHDEYWDGNGIVFEGGDEIYYPMTSLDFVAHEISHAYTEGNSGLYSAGEPGAINESFSDMAAQAAKYYTTGTANFLIGDEVVKPGVIQKNGKPMLASRYMNNPPQDGYSIDNVNNYTGQDSHYASGIYNKVYTLLAQSSGWTPESAFKLFARANALYWNPATGFIQGACDTLRAARDLDYNQSDVANAFSQAGITCPYRTDFTFTKIIVHQGDGGSRISRTFSLNEGFPQTGFAGASFSIITDETTPDIRWASSDSNTARVEQNGNVTLLKKGAATISASTRGTTQQYIINPATWFIIKNRFNEEMGDFSQADAYCKSQGDALPPIEVLSRNYGVDPYVGTLWNEWGYLKQVTTSGSFKIWSSTPDNNNYETLIYGLGYSKSSPAIDKNAFVCMEKP